MSDIRIYDIIQSPYLIKDGIIMRFSQLFCPTLKETPKDAEIVSHQLMLRAGMIKKVASGIYTYLPLGYKILRKFENIVREEMDKAGAQEVHLPSVIPAELWIESGRWDQYGKELLRIKDRNNNDFCYGPTHEEVITSLTKNTIKSYKQLPMNLYQIQTKFRDEIRPRFGLMRSRLFGMKDAYSFHETESCLDNTYEQMRKTYCNIFERCNLKFKIVEADSGSIGGNCSAEFMVTSQTGEDVIIECDNCSYAANIEAAETFNNEQGQNTNKIDEYKLVDTPNVKTIKELSDFFKTEERNFIKALIYIADEKPVLALLRGDHEINEIKLKKAINCEALELANEEFILKITGAPLGFTGPIGLKSDIPIYADNAIKTISSAYAGANKLDMHFSNVVPERDFKPKNYYDLRTAQKGDVCPKCKKGSFSFIRGIEVGHIFKLGDKYSKSMSAKFLDSQGKTKEFLMGCYGIGIGRTVAAAIEQSHDEQGIIWPMSLAPYKVNIIVANIKDQALMDCGEKIYDILQKLNIEVIIDDRKESAGIKFKDSDLIGLPIQLIIGRQFKNEGQIEMKIRRSKESFLLSEKDLLEKITQIINNEP
jgi:prolyl-tRNA synthetase